MTEEQRKLAEENMKLVMYYMKQKGLDYEEWVGTLMEELCVAAYTFDPGKGTKFSTYAFVLFDRTVFVESRKRHAKKRACELNAYSLDKEIGTELPGVPTLLKDLIPSAVDVEADAIRNIVTERVLAKLNQKYSDAIMMRLDGMTMEAIGKKLGVSRERVSKMLKNIRKIAEKEM